jgi:hypothetical protein
MAVFRYLFIVLLVLANAVLTVDAKAAETQIHKEGKEKQRQIEALEAKSRNGIIEFTKE